MKLIFLKIILKTSLLQQLLIIISAMNYFLAGDVYVKAIKFSGGDER